MSDEPFPLLEGPEDVVAYMAAELDRAGQPFSTGRAVDLQRLLGEPGEDYTRRSLLISEVEHKRRWIEEEEFGSSGERYRLTVDGVREARRLYLSRAARNGLREIINQLIADEARDSRRELEAITADHVRRNALGAGFYVEAVHDHVGRVLRRRAEGIAHAWLSVLQGQGCRVAEAERAEILADARVLLWQGSGDLEAAFMHPPGSIGGFPQNPLELDGLRDVALAAVAALLRSAQFAAAPPAPVGSPPFTITHSTIGAVQTGDRATAHVDQRVGTLDVPAFVDAVERVLRRLGELRDVPPNAAELLRHAITEARSPAPDPYRLRGFVGFVSDTLQGIAATPEVAQMFAPVLVALRQAIAG